MFNGFNDPVLTFMEDLKFILKEFIPDGAFMDKFGLFYARNGTDYVDGVWNMFTGKENNHNMGKVHSWNYSTESFFPGKCGRVKGGAGEFYPPRNVLCLAVSKILLNINNQTFTKFGKKFCGRKVRLNIYVDCG